MCSIYKNSNLRISRLAKRQIRNISPKFNNTVLLNAFSAIRTDVVCVSNHQSFRVHRCWISKLSFWRIFIFNRISIDQWMDVCIVINSLGNLSTIAVNPIRCSRRAYNRYRGLLPRIGNLRNSATGHNIAFSVKNILDLLHHLRRDTKLFVNTSTNLDYTLFINLLFDEIGFRLCNIHIFLSIFVKPVTNRRFINVFAKTLTHLTRNFAYPKTIFLQSLSSSDIISTPFIFANTELRAKFCRCHTHRLGNCIIASPQFAIIVNISKAVFSFLFNSTNEVYSMLIWIITRPPRIPSRSTRHSVMQQ